MSHFVRVAIRVGAGTWCSMQPTPYGFPPVVTGASRPTGKALLGASWRMLRQDRELLWLPLFGALGSLAAAVLLFVPGWFVGAGFDSANNHSVSGILGGMLAALAATVVG